MTSMHFPTTVGRALGLVFLASILVASAALAQAGPDYPKLNDELRAAIVDSLTTALQEVYVFPEKAVEMDEFVHARLAAGDYDDIDSPQLFADQLTEDFQSVCHDLHLGVRVGEPVPEYTEADEDARDAEQEAFVAEMAANNFGFAELEIMPGNVGYLKLNGFNPAEYGGETAIAAMNFLSNTDAIIFDLRDNGGGSPSMIQLISSYLFEEPVHLNSFYIRQTDEMRQFWTMAHVDGPRMTDQPAYVLTSPRTFSAAEEFTYNLKNLERATIVGQTTGGGAHPVNQHYFNFDGFAMLMSLPFGRAINPITGTNWEGTGVGPDLEVPVADALLTAHLDALTTLQELAVDESRRARLEWAIQGINSQLNPVRLGESEMLVLTGDYGPRHVLLEDGQLYYQRDGRPRMLMIPLGDDYFAVEGLDYFRMEFVRDESGKVQRVVGHYQNGRNDSNERSPSS